MPDGPLVADHARAGFRHLLERLLAETGLAPGDIDYFLLHQPNLRLIEALKRDLDIDDARTWINFPRCANTTSGTLPIALSEAVQAGRLHAGGWVCLGVVGAGFAGGIQLLRWGAACT
jgi:3-oxoacyl-[acyl-carrier-protein] synthase-3